MKPIEHVQALVAERRSWSDEAVLAELLELPVLPDEDDPAWDDEKTWHNHADLFVALAHIAADRWLIKALPLLLERASYGDPGEMMRGLRHSLEAAVSPHWDILAEICAQASAYPQPGARLWAISELGRLGDPQSFQTITAALDDSAKEVRLEAGQSLKMLSQTNEGLRTSAIAALNRYMHQHTEDADRQRGREAIEYIQSLSRPPN